MKKRIVVSLTLIVVLLALGIGGFAFLRSLRAQPPTVEPRRVALAVAAIRLQPVSLVAPIQGYGTARADQVAALSAEVSGQIISRADGLRDGASVRQGDVLFQIDPRENEAQLRRAQSQLAMSRSALEQIEVEERSLARLIATATEELAVAEREYSRVLELFEANTSNPRELDAARVVLQRARRALQELEGQRDVLPQRRAQLEAMREQRAAELAVAELNVERTTIVAPFTGRVSTVLVETGERVQPGQQLLTLLDPTLIEVPVELPVSRRPGLRVGARAQLQIENNPEAMWTGEVARIAPIADARTRTFEAYVEVLNTAQRQPLVPGMFVRARIEGPQLENVLMVPRDVVRRGRVFVSEDGVAATREVRIERRVLDQVVISGLPPGAIVITSNLDRLVDGLHVAPVVQELAAPAIAVRETPRATPPPETTGSEQVR